MRKWFLWVQISMSYIKTYQRSTLQVLNWKKKKWITKYIFLTIFISLGIHLYSLPTVYFSNLFNTSLHLWFYRLKYNVYLHYRPQRLRCSRHPRNLFLLNCVSMCKNFHFSQVTHYSRGYVFFFLCTNYYLF